MAPKRLLLAILVLAVAQMLVPDALAAPRRAAGGFRQGYEVNPYLTFTDFEDKTEIDDDVGIGFRFGYLFNPNHEIEFLFNDVATQDEFIPGENVDVTQFQAAYVFNFTTHDVVPYLTAGLGFVHTDDSDLGSETDQVLGLGGGVRFFLGRVLYTRLEGRVNKFEGSLPVFADGENLTFRELSFGVGWRFPTR